MAMKQHWTSIHVLRALAAMAVVAHHVPLYLEGRATFAVRTFEHGAAGVDLFFIISGFVMHRATLDKDIAWDEFLAKRAIRVLPMYWLVTVALAAVVWSAPFAFSTFTVSGADLIKSLAFIPVYTHDGLIRPVVAVGWTLYFEMLFYSLVAAWLVARGSNASLWAAASTVVLAAAARALDLSQPHSAFQLLSPILVEFALGVTLSHLFRAGDFFGRALPVRGTLALVLVAFGVFTMSLHDDNALGSTRVACWGLGSFLTVAGFLCVEPELNRALRLRRIFDPLGGSSYALYLVHGMAFSVVWKLMPSGLKANPIAVCSLLFVGPIAASSILHAAIEAPMTRALNQLIRRRIGNRRARTQAAS
jgi:exopolysaccharide production protein ExoZ